MSEAGTESVYLHPSQSLSPRHWVWTLLLCLIGWTWKWCPNKLNLCQNSSLLFTLDHETLIKIKAILIYPCSKTERCCFTMLTFFTNTAAFMMQNGSCLVNIKFIWVYYCVLMQVCAPPGAHLLTLRQYSYSGCFSINMLVHDYFKITNWKAWVFHSCNSCFSTFLWMIGHHKLS